MFLSKSKCYYSNNSLHFLKARCSIDGAFDHLAMEQRALKNVNNCLNINIYSYLEISGGQSYNLY
jgi:hypothetical protein